MFNSYICTNIKCINRLAVFKEGYCLYCGKALEKRGFMECRKIIQNKKKYLKTPEGRAKKEAEKLKKRGINPDNPIIGVGFYESMPGRLSVSDHNEYINGILELADTQLIVHKKSVWRGKDRGIKHILYDQIKSIDYDKGKSLSKSSIQLYLTNIEYSFKSSEPNRLKSFYEKLLKK